MGHSSKAAPGHESTQSGQWFASPSPAKSAPAKSAASACFTTARRQQANVAKQSSAFSV